MKKKILAIMLCVLAFSHGVHADFDYSQLDGLSKQELIELRREVTDRLKSYTEGSAQVDLLEGSGWVVKNYQDEFGRDTEEKYITTSEPITGTYDDRYSSGNPLTVKFYIGEEVYFELYKDESYLTTGILSDGDDCRIKILLPDGEVLSIFEDLSRSGKIEIESYYYDKFFDALLLGEDLKANISMYDGTESYSFTIPKCSNLQELYEPLFGTIPHVRHGSGEPIEVSITNVELSLNNGAPTVTATTNLPEGTKMHAVINSDNQLISTFSDGIVAKDGNIVFTDFSYPIYRHDISVRVSISLQYSQDDVIRDRLGDKNEMLTGDIADAIAFAGKGYQTLFSIK